MKKVFSFLVATSFCLVSFGQLLTENFSYTAGQLLTANGWVAQSSTGTNALTVTSPGLVYSGHPGSGVGNAVTMATSGEDASRILSSAVATGSVYMSFLVNISAVQSGDYFIGLHQSSTTYPLRVFAKSDGAGGFQFGLNKSGTPGTYETTSRALSTTYFLVVKYTYNTGSTTDDVVDLWVNPALGVNEPAATIAGVTGTASDATTISGVYLRQGTSTSASTQQVDAIQVGTTWASVTSGTAVATPTLTLGSISSFGSVTTGLNSTAQTVTVTGSNLSGAPGTLTVTSPNSDFQVSSDNVNFAAQATIPFTSSTLNSTSFYVRFTPQSNGAKSGSVTVSGGGATAALPVSGTGISIAAPVATAASAISGTGFTANWNAVPGAVGYFIDVYTQSSGLVTSTIAGWNFPVNSVTSQTADVGNSNNINIQLISAQGFTASSTISYPSGPSGTTGSPNPYSVSTDGWDNGADSKFWQADVNTTEASSITLSSLQGASSTGPRNFKLQYRVGSSGGWTDVTGGALTITTTVTGGSLSTWFGFSDLPIPSEVSNKPLVSFRWIQSSNSPVSSGTSVASSGTSRISAVYIKGQTTGTINNYLLQNQSVGNVTSYAVTGLTPGTTYYYVVRAVSGGVSSINSNVITATTVAAAASISATTLNSFPATCVNSTAGPNSFTITGSNLSAGTITVGPLAGYSFATTAGGTYTSSLSIATSGGSLSQEVFVRFTPTAAQSFNGSILVTAGTLSTSVEASGSGINTAATVVTGSASSVGTTGATLAGTISSTGCSSVTTYGVEYSTTNGFANGSGTQVASSNLASGAFSAVLSSLTPATTYYYKAYATNGGGTTYGVQQSFTTAAPAPVLSATALTAFGSVCVGTAAGPNSFTITGSNLAAGNITVAALAGYTYATSTGGTYTSSLSIAASGGSLTQDVFVRFTPTAVQSFSGTILITAGTASASVAASGTGINTASTVVTGSASAISTSGATLAGTISSTGCSSVTAYGIEYSTTNGFTNGSGTQVGSSNLASGAFSAILSSLTPATTYYYKAYATNGGGTTYGAQQSFTTFSPSPTLVATSLNAFGAACVNTTVGPNSFTITGSNLSAGTITVGPLAGYSFATTAGGTYTSSLAIAITGGSLTQDIFVRFTPTAVQSFNGNIAVVSGTISTTVAATGSGINTAATVVTGSASSVSTTGATLAATISSTGCSSVTTYGVEYSTTSGFANGSGTQVASSNLASGAFSAVLSSLTPATTYYYKAYATNAGGTSYGTQQSFTTLAPAPVLNASSLTAFGNICVSTAAGPNSFTITGTNLAAGNVGVAALAGFTYATSAGGTYTSSLSIATSGGSFSQEIFVRFTPTATQSFSGTILITAGTASASVAASGSGVNTAATVITGSASSVSATGATLAGTISSTGCSSVTAYGVEYSTTNGFANGSGTQVASSNLATGAFSVLLSSLTPSTTYYYKAYATNSGGISYGSQQSFTTLAPPPSISASALSAFGNVCLNTVAGPNSFTITGTNLAAGNITVAALAGYTYATSAGGTYTSSLSIATSGGSFSQVVFVRFTPTAVQSYNGNILVSGGGVTMAIAVAASGSGVNTASVVITGAANAITTSSATLLGSISSAGCSAVTVYGVEYSTTNGFANGSGTSVVSTNLASGNFSAGVAGLTPATTYYYKSYATSAAGTSYGNQQTFTTITPPPTLTATSLSAFGNVCVGAFGGPSSFTINGNFLTNALITVGPLAGFTFSTSPTGSFNDQIGLIQTGGTLSTTVFVRFVPVLVQAYTGNISVSGGGATSIQVAASGNGVNTAPASTTGGASNITTTGVTLAGSYGSGGCSAVMSYGIEYSSQSGFSPGSGIRVNASGVSAGGYSVDLTGLVPNTNYYYRSFVTIAGAVAYGSLQSFRTLAIPDGLRAYPNPVDRGATMRITHATIVPGNYVLQLVNQAGQLVWELPVNIQAGFINRDVQIPIGIGSGMYHLRLVNESRLIDKAMLLIF